MSTASRATRLTPVARSGDAGGSWRPPQALRLGAGAVLAAGRENGARGHGDRERPECQRRKRNRAGAAAARSFGRAVCVVSVGVGMIVGRIRRGMGGMDMGRAIMVVSGIHRGRVNMIGRDSRSAPSRAWTMLSGHGASVQHERRQRRQHQAGDQSAQCGQQDQAQGEISSQVKCPKRLRVSTAHLSRLRRGGECFVRGRPCDGTGSRKGGAVRPGRSNCAGGKFRRHRSFKKEG